MVSKYKRKTNRGSWTEETMQKAMDEAKTSSIRSASKTYGVPIGTLHRHIKKGDPSRKLGRFQPVFSKELEQKICDLAIERDTLFYGLTKDSLKELAFEVAKLNKISHPFSSNKAGRAWVDGFMKRHPQLTHRTPEPTALARCSAFNRTQVERFYDNLWDVISQHQFLTRPDDIYNMDETGVKTSASRPPRVISKKGKRQVGVIATAEKGQLTTVICTCSATGRFISPCFIFGQRKRMNERLLDGSPNGSQAWCSDSGWITNSTFNNWLQMFIDKTRPTADRPVLLILDNHSTHQNLEALNLARENHVIMVSIPPHTSHKLQPLDVSVYRSFKVAFEQAIDTFQKNHPGRRVTQFDIARLVCTAYEKCATVKNATSGFRKTGIFPYNRNLFTDLDFAPASVYENAPINENADADTTENLVMNSDNATVLEVCKQACMPLERDDVIKKAKTFETNYVTENEGNADIEGNEKSGVTVEKDVNKDVKVAQIEDERTECHVNCISLEQPSTSYIISPKKILPSPKLTPTIKKRKNRCQKSEILTSSPFKSMLEEKNKLKKKPKLDFKQDSNEKENIGKGKGNAIRMEKGKQKRAKKTDEANNKIENAKQPLQEDVFCLFCGEEYEEPPIEDWLQCPSCCEWAHELCTDSENGCFLCINCKT